MTTDYGSTTLTDAMGSTVGPRRYRTYNTADLDRLPQFEKLPDEQRHAMQMVARVLPFKANFHVVEDLIDWSNPADPIFKLKFPQKGMLRPARFEEESDPVSPVAAATRSEYSVT